MTTIHDLMDTLRVIAEIKTSRQDLVFDQSSFLDEQKKKAEKQLKEIIDEQIRQYFSADGK